MKKHKKASIPTWLFAALATAILFAPVRPIVAEERGETDSRAIDPAKKDAAKSHAVEFQAIQARSKTVVAGVDFNDVEAARRARTQLAKNRVAFAAYAKARGLKITSKEYTHPPIAKRLSCASTNPHCVLVDAYLDKQGRLRCVYDCTPPEAEKNPK